MMNKKTVMILLILISSLFLISCSTEEVVVENNIVGETYENLKEKTSLQKESYVEAFDFEEIPKTVEMTEYFLKNLDYPGNLGPFPTKSLQDYAVLKTDGIIDSENVKLAEFYLLEGPQTKITDVVKNNANFILNGTTTEETVKNIMNWEHKTLDCSKQEAQQYKKRERTAEQIILSECATGCTDYTLVFAALARAKDIPATVIETVREKWIAEMVWNNKWNRTKEGHFFSEVYLKEKNAWVVVDPTGSKLTGRDGKGYYPSGPGGNKRYMLFERGLDSWDYGIETGAEFGEIVKKRYYIEGSQP
jgi:transglutaminase-like putative cysteine protease